MTHKFSGANVVQIYKTKIATIYHPNDCDLISYSKRDLNPHSRNGQGILSPSCLPIPPFEHPFKERAENETRTRDPNLGKVMLYQLSYFRIFSFAVAKVGIFRKPANILHTFFHRNLFTLHLPQNNHFDYQLIRSR